MAMLGVTVGAWVLVVTSLQVIRCSCCNVKCNPCMDVVCADMNDAMHATDLPPSHHMPYSSCGCPRTSCCSYHPNPYAPRIPPQNVHPYGPPCSSFPYPPYPYPPMQMPQHPPSYCVQSVVVGGKAEVEEKRHNRTHCHGSPRPSVDPSGRAALDPSAGGGANVAVNGVFDPSFAVNAALDPGVNANVAIDPSTSVGVNQSAQAGAGQDPSANVDRYERYIERLLSALGDRCNGESECVPSPMMVVSSPHSSCRPTKVRKLRRRASKRYHLSSCEEDGPYVVVDDEEDQGERANLFVAHPHSSTSTCCREPTTYCCCCRSTKPCRRRNSCCTSV